MNPPPYFDASTTKTAAMRVLVYTDPAQQEADIDALRQALKESKGPGNFRNLFMSTNGKKDGVQPILVSEVHARDKFFNIKNSTTTQSFF